MRSGHSWCSRALALALVLAMYSCGDSNQRQATTGVTRSERVWVDTTRRTPPTAAYAGASSRTLRVLIWKPDAHRVLPLLVMAHGFGGLPEKFDAFARTVAAAGFVVAAPAFPLTNEDAPGGHELGLRDLPNQPGDLSFLITALLEANANATDPLHGQLAAPSVALLGHSLGGVTALALTRKDCCRDARVQATILASTPTLLADVFGSDPITRGPPTLVLHGMNDPTVGYQTAVDLYAAIAPPRFLVGLRDAGHSEALESQSTPAIAARDAAQQATIAFLNLVFGNQAAPWSATLQRLASDGNVTEADPGDGGPPRGGKR